MEVWSTPVSYTHLDVYKRQGEDNGNVVKTAIIKIHIVRKTVVPEINVTETKDEMCIRDS